MPLLDIQQQRRFIILRLLKPTAVFTGTLDEHAVHIFTVPVHLISRPHRQGGLAAFIRRRRPSDPRISFLSGKAKGRCRSNQFSRFVSEGGSKRWGDRAIERWKERATDPKVIAHDDLLRHGEKTKGPLTCPIPSASSLF